MKAMRSIALIVAGCVLAGAAATAEPDAGGAGPASLPRTAQERFPLPAPESRSNAGRPAGDNCPGVVRGGVCELLPEPGAGLPPARPDDLLFSGSDPILSPQEEAALGIADRWQEGNAASVSLSGKNGVITYKYGVQQPSIVCAVLQVCDVALQQGERITAINLGDTVRWTVEPAVAGTEEKAIQHVIIKPLDVGLETSLVVTTDRRIYHMRLRSHRTRYMPQVAFTYPDGIGLGKKPGRGPASPGRAATGTPGGAGPRVAAPTAAAPAVPEQEYLSNINFDYRITGEAPWKPVRAYNDGRRTYIHMPAAAAMSQAEAPTLLVVGAGEGRGTPVGYAVEGDSYVVDGVFDKALLVAGTGANQNSVTIERGGR